MTNEAEKELRCSFCGKDQDEVTIIIAGHLNIQAYICNKCVAVCNNLIAGWVEKRGGVENEKSKI